MDALNTLYVATTRTRKHLYVTAPGKKGNDEVNSLLAGDLLLAVLPKIADELDVGFHGGILLGEEEEPDIAARQNSMPTNWSFDYYPATTRVKDELVQPEMQPELDIVRLDTAKRHGQLLHELMAETASAT